jgi:hypothetical protein
MAAPQKTDADGINVFLYGHLHHSLGRIITDCRRGT